MKRVIFTLYDDIKIDSRKYLGKRKIDLSAEKDASVAKELITKDYFDLLVTNKEDYAKKINVDFKFFHNTMKEFDVDTELEFTKINLYKHHLFAQLAEEYDEVMYVDMDVVFNTDLNIFDEHDLSKGIHIKDQDYDIVSKNKEALNLDQVGLRSPVLKYHITKDLLDGGDNHVINTGIMLANSEHIKKIHFIERMKEAIIKIQEIKKENLNRFFEDLYFANNESIFSYILEKYKIPYVIFDDKWHKIYDHRPADKVDAHCIHYINKQFNAFFNKKTKCIFSLYVHIDDNKLDAPPSYRDNEKNKSKIAQEQFAKYENELIQNHKDYAKAIDATYLRFTRDEKYENFIKKFPDLSEYDAINLYKIYLLDKLTYEYDYVMYIDYDVWFRNHRDIFDTVPVDYAICCQYDDKHKLHIYDKSQAYFTHYTKDFRNPQAKYWNAHALLNEDNLEPDNNVYNTGVICASRYGMDKLDYFSNIDEIIKTMKELKEDEYSFYPENIRASFGYDNETIFSYKCQKNDVLIYRLPESFHFKQYYGSKAEFNTNSISFKTAKGRFEQIMREVDVTIVHLISKNFSLVFDK